MKSYASIVDTHILEGWTPYLLTFMFDHLGGNGSRIIESMKREIEQFYARIVTRIVRKPRKHTCPVLIGCADRPVSKSTKAVGRDFAINDGVHFHAMFLVPPNSRLREPLDKHVRDNSITYVPPDSIMSIHVAPVTETPEKVTQYVLKSLPRRRFDHDAVLVLPKAVSELPPLSAAYVRAEGFTFSTVT